MTKKVFVAGLPYSITDDLLKNHFEQVGTVISALVIMDKYSGQSKGFGFVEMSSVEEAQAAIDTLNNTSFQGRNIIVSEAKPQEDRRRDPKSHGNFDNRRNGFDRSKKDNGRNRW